MNIKKYKKKPVIIEAMQLIGSSSDFHAVYQWVESHVGSTKPPQDYSEDEPYPGQGVTIDPATGCMLVWTLEGVMTAKPGDYIIRGIQGEFYPCKPDIFADSYEEVIEEDKG